jgi:hypothetical protein
MAGGSTNLVKATMDVIDEFCTVSPPSGIGRAIDLGLKAKIQSVIHGADVDGAFDEQRCIRELFTSGKLPMMKRIGI